MPATTLMPIWLKNPNGYKTEDTTNQTVFYR